MKIRTEIPSKIVDMYTIMFSEEPTDIINGLHTAIAHCKQAGYTNLEIQWSWGDDSYPHLYGLRDETEKEKSTRLKLEAKKKVQSEKTKQREIVKAQQTLEKYGIK